MIVSHPRSYLLITVTLMLGLLRRSAVVDAAKVRGAKDDDRKLQQPGHRHLKMQEECTLTIQDVDYYSAPDLSNGGIVVRRELKKKKLETPKSVSKWCCELSTSDAAATGMNFVYVNGLSEAFYTNHSVAPGESTLLADGSLNPVTMEMTITSEATAKVGKKEQKKDKKKNKKRRMRHLDAEGDDEDAIEEEDDEEEEEQDEENYRHGRRLATVGTKRVLVVRVRANDVATTSTAAQLIADVFDANNLSLRTQYAACSLNQLQMVPAIGTNPVTQRPYNNGVTTIRVNMNARGNTNDAVRNAVINRLGGKPPNVDHVMLCIPPGTIGGWIAYAYVNSWLSVYNDEWCRSLSAQLHELGHNFNLDHSGEGTEEYGDQSGMMGYSYFNNNAPQMCFNPAKTWQLGWFAATGETTEWNRAFGSRTYALVGVGRPTRQVGKFVIVKIPNGATDLYVGYNRNVGSNAGVVEDPNEVTIVSRAAGTGFASSLKLAALAVGGSYTVPNYLGTGTPLTILFSSRQALGTDNIGQANVAFTFAPATTAPTRSPTQSPTTGVSATARPTPFPTTARPTPFPTTARPTPLPTTARPTPFPTTARPTPLPTTARPTPFPTTAQPTPFPTTLQPTPFPTTVQPTPFPTTVQPTPFPTTAQPTPFPTTVQLTPFPTNVAPTTLPTVNQCGNLALFSLKILTDNFPGDTSWTLRSGQTVVASRAVGTYTTPGTSETTQVCLGEGTYNLTISDSYGDGLCCTQGIGNFEGSVNGGTVFNGGRFDSVDTKTFTVGGCTASDEIKFSMQIRTDQYPDETSWDLHEVENGVTSVKVASGGGYRLQHTLLPPEDFCIKRTSSTGASKCYSLRLRDTYGDGMCCSEGNGSYNAVIGPADPNNSFTMTGGQFKSEEVKTFCLS